MPLAIQPLHLPHPGLQALLADSLADDQSMVRRLWKEWKNGGNTFALPGEALFGAFADRTLVGVCGLNRDPYTGQADVGRLRHLYVHRSWRRAGAGRALVERSVAEARRCFRLVELRTISPEADRFYRRLGFTRVDRLFATHELPLAGHAAEVAKLA